MDPQMIALWVGVGLVIGIVLTLVGSLLLGLNHLRTARREAAQIVVDAEREAASAKKEASTAIKEQRIQLREKMEREAKEQRRELVSMEKRILAKEENLDKRMDALEEKATALAGKERELDAREAGLDKHKERLEAIIAQQTEKLESVSGMSANEAKQELFKQLETEVRRESALRLKRIEDELNENGEKKARWIMTQAIQRCAADHVAESVVSVVPLPNDDMKGRIIGREGRNIRAFEQLTGINLIIDDTPEAVILSSFDPVRREVGRITLENLIADGRIHPARIEEMFKKAETLVEQQVHEAGEQAVFDTGIHNLHGDVVRTLGRLRYRTSYGQNVLKHSLEVAFLSGVMAAELGLDPALAKRAGLLHDLGKAIDHEVEGPHAVIGADLARRLGENKEVVHCIEAHHGDVEPQTVEAVIVQAADAISAARPGARRETLESYIKRLEKLEALAESHSGVEKSYAMQAGREIRVMVKPEEVSDAEATLMARDLAKQIEEELQYPGQIKVMIIRESRSIDYAK